MGSASPVVLLKTSPPKPSVTDSPDLCPQPSLSPPETYKSADDPLWRTGVFGARYRSLPMAAAGQWRDQQID